jgi:anti-anti-sigma regulatory factor
MTFSDAAERLDLVARFVRDGLRHHERVLCLTDAIAPEQLSQELSARRVGTGAATRRGQLTIAATDRFLFGPDHGADVLEVLLQHRQRAARDGYAGVRVTADMCWATRPAAPTEQLTEFEMQVGQLFTDGKLSVICQYDRDRFDAVTLAFAASTHPKTVAAQVYFESVLLRICRQYSPAGVRIAGELDYRQRDVLEQAIAESRRLDRHMHINLADLDYIDAACAAVIAGTGIRLPGSRRMTITCRSLVAKVLHLVGVNTAPRVRVVQLDD